MLVGYRQTRLLNLLVSRRVYLTIVCRLRLTQSRIPATQLPDALDLDIVVEVSGNDETCLAVPT